jgi:hypothetical protein
MSPKHNPGFEKLYELVDRQLVQPDARTVAIAMVLTADSVELTDLLMPVAEAACATWAEHHPAQAAPRLRIGQHEAPEMGL